jgi:uncharacterized protein YbaR (Trm112 family)
MEAEEKLKILDCPICRGEHTYKLKVERTYVIERLTTNDLTKGSQPAKFTRIFVCPVKNQKFQATFRLYQTTSAEIKSVTIGGVIEDEEE